MPPHEQESTEPSCPSEASIFFPIKIDHKYTIPCTRIPASKMEQIKLMFMRNNEEWKIKKTVNTAQLPLEKNSVKTQDQEDDQEE